MRINSPRETTSYEMENYLANASICTSVGLDWGSLVVRTRSEPARCRYLHLPATPDPWLVLTTGGGPRKTEVRGRSGWRGAISGCGNIAITSPGKATEIRWDEGDGSAIESIHVCVDAALFYRFAAETVECDPRRVELIDGFAQSDPLIEPVMKALAHELNYPEASDRLFRDSAAQLLVAHLLRKHCAFPLPVRDSVPALSSRKLRLVRDYIEAELSNSLKLEDLAAVIHVSSFHFARMFKTATGQTPHAYVTRLRLERAQDLLRHSDLSIAKIARTVGFSSKSHFAAIFLRSTGLTPNLFRSTTH
jgi:AraC family transcriptional regulator